jgi:hypothetical protein
VRPYRRTRPGRLARARYDALLADHLAGADERPDDLARYLDHLASLERFVFHGSNHAHAELRPAAPDDSREFGRQDAVYATPDPHWAMYYAVVERSNARLLLNGSLAFRAGSRTRWYRRDVRVADPALPLTTRGFLHVLPRAGFRAEPRVALGLVDLAHWVSVERVRPLFVLAVDPADYPPAALVRRVP